MVTIKLSKTDIDNITRNGRFDIDWNDHEELVTILKRGIYDLSYRRGYEQRKKTNAKEMNAEIERLKKELAGK